MATVLGKRKSRTSKAEPSVSQDDARAIFQRHFEAQFVPLDPVPSKQQEKSKAKASEDGNGAEGGEEEWSGLSDDESRTTVEVIDHTTTSKTTAPTLSKRETKAFLSSRTPALVTSTTESSATKPKAAPTAAEEDSASLLKNDLALQRLLSESHLFSAPYTNSFSSATSHEHEGRNRHLATDLRLSALGSKASIYKQAKMPMSMRKGIASAAESRETKRRREAKENGIVLERPAPAKEKKDRVRKRELAVDAPAVGRLRDGMLKLSKKDIQVIEGSGGRRGGKTKRKRR